MQIVSKSSATTLFSNRAKEIIEQAEDLCTEINEAIQLVTPDNHGTLEVAGMTTSKVAYIQLEDDIYPEAIAMAKQACEKAGHVCIVLTIPTDEDATKIMVVSWEDTIALCTAISSLQDENVETVAEENLGDTAPVLQEGEGFAEEMLPEPEEFRGPLPEEFQNLGQAESEEAAPSHSGS